MRQIFSDLKSIPKGFLKFIKAMRFVLKAVFNSNIIWEEKFEGDNGLQRWWDLFLFDWTCRMVALIIGLVLFYAVSHSSWCSENALYK